MLDESAHDLEVIEREADASSIADPEPDEETRKHGGGPHTPEGKATCSQNSVTHGCRSHILILHGERQEDYDALLHLWLETYQPRDPATHELVEQLVHRKWFLLRNEKHFREVSEQLSYAPLTKWNDQQHKIYQLAARYQTTAERAVSKAQSDLETFLKNRRAEESHRHKLRQETHTMYLKYQQSSTQYEHQQEEEIQKATKQGIDTKSCETALDQLKAENRNILKQLRHNLAELEPTPSRAKVIFHSQHSPKKLRPLSILEQWVEIKIDDAGTVTTHLTPSNEKLIQRGQTLNPPPELVYRRLNFPAGIPDIYDWTYDGNHTLKQHGGIAIQRMPVETWLDLIEQEAQRADGHIGPAPITLPRPPQHGGCECLACQRNQQLLEARNRPPHQQNPPPRPSRD